MKYKRSMYNIIFGLASQIITISLGIIIPRLFIVRFGSEANGLLSSINQIFIYFGLLEAGVGVASIQALYAPISKKDLNGINGILSATSRYYKRTGTYYCISVLILAIIYPFFITSSLKKIEVAVIILLTGMSGAISFFFQGKFRLLLTAEGKGYVISIITTIIAILANFAKIIMILTGYNIVLIQTAYFLINILQMFIFGVYIKRNYAWINLGEKPNNEALSQKSSVLVHQAANLIFSNTDVLILTIFCGLKVVSVYVIYNMIFQMVNTAIGYLNEGILFVLGQAYHQSKKEFIKLYDVYEVYYVAIVFAIHCITYILILPFIRLYTNGISDISYIDIWLPILFVILKLLSCGRVPGVNAINIAGHFRKTQYRAILESAINIVASIMFVNVYGIYGVLIGTIIALLYRTNDIILYANKYIIKRSPWRTYKRLFINIAVFLSIILISSKLNIHPYSYANFVILAVILTIIIIPIFVVIISLFEIKVCKDIFNHLRKPRKETQVVLS